MGYPGRIRPKHVSDAMKRGDVLTLSRLGHAGACTLRERREAKRDREGIWSELQNERSEREERYRRRQTNEDIIPLDVYD